MACCLIPLVMAGLDPAIQGKTVNVGALALDGRLKGGHDSGEE